MQRLKRYRISTLIVVSILVGAGVELAPVRLAAAFHGDLAGASLIAPVLGPALAQVETKRPVALPRITPEQAKVLAVNKVRQSADGVHLRHRQYRADFKADGLHVKTRHGHLSWHWRFASIGTDAGNLPGVTQGLVTPQMTATDRRTVRYERGALVEQYVMGVSSVEQQFVISSPLSIGEKDLVIRGEVRSAGRFVALPDQGGWQWRSEKGVVRLGDVTVVDATGAVLPAVM